MTRTIEEYNEVLKLFKEGKSKVEISKLTSIPRGTITDWTLNKIDLTTSKQRIETNPLTILSDENKIQAYVYLLGSYLGDGCITQPQSNRAAKLRITCDNKQPYVIQSNLEAIKILFPNNTPSIQAHQTGNCSIVGVYSSNLYSLFPQAKKGGGNKNTRDVSLVDWQLPLVKGRETYLLKGLFHSDGSFFKGNKKYYRYQFTNTSLDIINIIKNCLSVLKIQYCLTQTQPLPLKINSNNIESICKLRYNILIQHKESVKILYKHVGTKYNEVITELE